MDPLTACRMLNNGYERVGETEGGAPTKLRSPNGKEIVRVDHDRQH